MDKLTLIIPVHKINKEIGNYLNDCIKSIIKQEKIDADKPTRTIIVCPKSVKDKIYDYVSIDDSEKLYLEIVENTSETDYQSQVNLGVEKVKTDYFTVIEFDDELSNTYLYNAERYVKSYPKTNVFLSLIIETDLDNKAIKLTNETVWSQQFNEGNLGTLTEKTLNDYSDFKLSGAIIKTKPFKEIGGYKKNIKLTFMYEFLLRAIHNNFTITTIPKVIYKHLIKRKDSLFEHYLNNMTIEERRFWFDVAKKEYYFTEDREIDFVKP